LSGMTDICAGLYLFFLEKANDQKDKTDNDAKAGKVVKAFADLVFHHDGVK
jgi:hypothetical protein